MMTCIFLYCLILTTTIPCSELSNDIDLVETTPSFSYNLKNFDDFMCSFGVSKFEASSSKNLDKRLIHAQRVFYNVFCVFFLYSELKNDSTFFDWTRRLFLCKHHICVKPISSLLDYSRIKPSFMTKIRSIEDFIDSLHNENSDDDFVIVETKDDRVIIKCNEEFDFAGLSNSKDFGDRIMRSAVRTDSVLEVMSEQLVKRYSELKSNHINDFPVDSGYLILEVLTRDLLFNELQTPLNFNFRKALKDLFEGYKTENNENTSFNEYQDIYLRRLNIQACRLKLHDILYSALRDSNMVQFVGSTYSSDDIDFLSERIIKILDEW